MICDIKTMEAVEAAVKLPETCPYVILTEFLPDDVQFRVQDKERKVEYAFMSCSDEAFVMNCAHAMRFLVDAATGCLNDCGKEGESHE